MEFSQSCAFFDKTTVFSVDGGDHFKDTMCDLCDKVFPYPVTYHMKQVRAHTCCFAQCGFAGCCIKHGARQLVVRSSDAKTADIQMSCLGFHFHMAENMTRRKIAMACTIL